MEKKRITAIRAKLSLTELLFCKKIPEMIEEVDKALLYPVKTVDYDFRGKKYRWGLTPGRKNIISNKSYILGRLIRTNQEIITEYDIKTDTEIKSIAENYLKDMLHYVFDKEKEIFIIEYKSNMTIDSVCTALERLLLSNTEGIGKLEIISKKRNKDFINSIKSLNKINYVKFTLYPSNPEYSPIYENLERGLKKAGYSKSELHISGNQLNYNGTILEEATHKVIASQGEVVYSGLDENNKTKVYHSKNYSEKIKIDVLYDTNHIFTGLASLNE